MGLSAMTKIKSFWDARASDASLAHDEVTHPDVWQHWLEIETIKRLIPASDTLIDIGCGTGFATRQYAALSRRILGIDNSEEMIKRATAPGIFQPANAIFSVADVLDLAPSKIGVFDVAITARCLINLPDWTSQQRALSNISQVVRPGGLYIFAEGVHDGRMALNEIRRAVGLEVMPPVWHNRDLDRAAVLEYLDPYFTLEREIGFGAYDLVARVFHPLFVAPDKPAYQSKINEIAARIALERPNDTANSRMALFCLRRRQ
jgi:SAM-dependent methyltransferase